MTIDFERLKQLRQSKNVTQKHIASEINVTEVSYQRYEYGTVCPSLDALLALADFFDVSIDYLVGRSDNPKVNQ